MLHFSLREIIDTFRKQKRKVRIKNVVGDGFTNKEASTKFVSLRCGYQKCLQGCRRAVHRFRSKLTAHFFRRVFKWLGSVSALRSYRRSLWTLLRPRTSSCILVANGEGHFWQVLEVRFWCGLVFPSVPWCVGPMCNRRVQMLSWPRY